MNFVFVSNYLNHHQIPFCMEMNRLTEGQFAFIATETMKEERVKLGYKDPSENYDFVLRAYESEESKQKALQLCYDCDVLIYGSAPDEYFKARVKAKKLTFKYGERFFKTPFTAKNIVKRTLSMMKHVIPYQNKNHYLLCASAYMASDCALYGCFKNRCLKWGYFPECKKYDDIDTLVASKKKNSLLWCGRLIDWKHPELAIEVAKRLKAEGYDFTLDIVGNGALESDIADMIANNGLSDCVFMRGSMSPDKVREYMEQSEIFMFTSDRQEGWGAVLNESMNSACAVVADRAIGSVPFVVKDGENGAIYSDCSADELYSKVKCWIDEPEKRRAVAMSAYKTISENWNATVAAVRLVEFARNEFSVMHDCGPCSQA